MKLELALALGIWFANWLVVPLLGTRTFSDGFVIGAMAAPLYLAAHWLFARIRNGTGFGRVPQR